MELYNSNAVQGFYGNGGGYAMHSANQNPSQHSNLNSYLCGLFQVLPVERAVSCWRQGPCQQAAHCPGHAEDHTPHQAVVMPHPVLPSHRVRPGMGRAQAPYGRLQTATGCCCCCWGCS